MAAGQLNAVSCVAYERRRRRKANYPAKPERLDIYEQHSTPPVISVISNIAVYFLAGRCDAVMDKRPVVYAVLIPLKSSSLVEAFIPS